MTLVKTKNSPDVYYLENGMKRYVSAAEFAKRGFSDSEIMIVNQAHLDGYKASKNLE